MAGRFLRSGSVPGHRAGVRAFRRLFAGCGVLVLAVLTVVGVGGAPPASADETPTVTVVPTVVPRDGVACPPGATTSSTCYALGDNPAYDVVPVAADGTSVGAPVQIEPAGTVSLFGIGCPNATTCVAVGFIGGSDVGVAVPITVSGDTITPGTPVDLGLAAFAVSCPDSTHCVVAGSTSSVAETDLITVSGATLIPAPPTGPISGGGLSPKSMVCSSVTACLIGGSGGGPNPGSPSQGRVANVDPATGGVATAVPAMRSVDGVACQSPTDLSSCEVVGAAPNGHGALDTVNNGTPGTVTVLDNLGELNGVSCVGTTCEAVGLTGSPDDATATAVALPVIAGAAGPARVIPAGTVGSSLARIVCVSTSSCVAGGSMSVITPQGGNTEGIVVSIAPSGPASPTPPPIYCLGTVTGPIVATADTPDGQGYWETDAAGKVINCGDAVTEQTLLPQLAAPVVGMAPGPDDNGYYLVAADGGVFTEGDAPFHGSAGDLHLNKPVIGMAVDRSTQGYWLAASDGGVFSYNAPFHGSAGNIPLNKPVIGITGPPSGDGYLLVASDGGVFTYNTAFYGSGQPNVAAPHNPYAPPRDTTAGSASNSAR